MDTNPLIEHFGLAGKVCVVTGGSSGIGRASALALARLGANVAIISQNGEGPGAQSLVTEVRSLGGQALSLSCDTSDQPAVQRAAREVAQALGPADVLVNAAGVLKAGSLAELSLADWNRVLAVNLTGYFICSQAFGQGMLKRGQGVIVHIASIMAAHPIPQSGAYAMAKAGVAMLSSQLAIEWGPEGVRSNTVCPGMTWTAMTEPAYSRPGEAEHRSSKIPLGRIGQAEEMADAVAFLASQRSAYVNGADLTVDGGFTRNLMSMIPRTAQ